VSCRVPVTVGVVYLGAIGLASLASGLPLFRRALAAGARAGRWPREAIIALGLSASGVALQLLEPATLTTAALDWLPGVYLLAGYWLPARLAHRPAPRLQARLEAIDDLLFEAGLAGFLDRAPRLLFEYLEAAYLGCYVMVPAALAWAFLAGHGEVADRFWTVVLLAALPCYTLVVWFETRPPRCIETPRPGRRRAAARSLNLAILDLAGTGFNTFPSGHTAASFAAALAVGAAMPLAGIVLGVLALSIAIGSVAGRYHYALDAVLGVLAAIVAFAVSRML
jgi:membrane-associated phospholipid phosphatase